MSDVNIQILTTTVLRFQNYLQELSQQVDNLASMIMQVVPPSDIPTTENQKTWAGGLMTKDQQNKLAAAAALGMVPFGAQAASSLGVVNGGVGGTIYGPVAGTYYNPTTGMVSTGTANL